MSTGKFTKSLLTFEAAIVICFVPASLASVSEILDADVLFDAVMALNVSNTWRNLVDPAAMLSDADDAAILYTGTGNGFSNKGYTSAARLAAQQATRELREFCRQMK